MKTKKKEIYDRLVKNIKLSKMQEKNNLYSKISTHKIKSYSPYINNNLDVKKLKTLKFQPPRKKQKLKIYKKKKRIR